MSGQAKQMYLVEEDFEHILGVAVLIASCSYRRLQQNLKKPAFFFGQQHKLHGINKRNLTAVR